MARGDRVQVIIGAVDRVAAPIRKINRQIETMLAPVRRVKKAFAALAREAHLDKVWRGVLRLGRGVRNLAAGGIAGLGALGYALDRLTQRGDTLAKLTRRIKFNSDAFQELQFAADREGVSNADFQKSVGVLAKNIGLLKAGTGSLGELLKKVDPQFARILATTTDTSEAFDLVVKKIGSFKDPAKQAALAGAAFGRSGLVMVQFARIGAEQIDRLRARARELGLVMTGQALEDSEVFQDSLTDLRAVAFGLWQQIGSALIPTVRKIVDQITEWTVRNQEWIKTGAVKALEKMIVVVQDLWAWLGKVIKQVGAWIEASGGLPGVAIKLSAALAPFRDAAENINAATSAVSRFTNTVRDPINAIDWAPQDRRVLHRLGSGLNLNADDLALAGAGGGEVRGTIKIELAPGLRVSDATTEKGKVNLLPLVNRGRMLDPGF